jgi:thioredoxin reductase
MVAAAASNHDEQQEPIMTKPLVVVVGAGPVGLAAAAHLVKEGLEPLVLEAGDTVGASVASWGHVRLFSPWHSNIDAAAAGLLIDAGWTVPDLDTLPTGRELVDDYLIPLSEVPELAGRIRLGARVTAIGRSVDKVDHDRRTAPFVIRFTTANGEREVQATSVIDASGTWLTPNPLGANGLPARGENAVRDRLYYGIPDVLGRDQGRYRGRTTAVVGSGHSAANAILALLQLRREEPSTTIHWLIRGTTLRALGGGSADQLAARGKLGNSAGEAVRTGAVRLHEGFPVREVRAMAGRLELGSDIHGLEVDEIVVAAGQRPDRALTEELRLDLDLALDSTKALGPLIDPNVHSCGTVRPHTYQALTHADEVGFFTVGAKSYGRAPTFLMATGYEQVRSVTAHLAGDEKRAAMVNLVLPETGACSVGRPSEAKAGGELVAAGAGACCG